MRVWAAAIDSDCGLQCEIFTSEKAMQDWLLAAFDATREEFEASGEDLADFLEPIVEQTIDSWTYEYVDIEP